MNFSLNETEVAALNEWNKSHDCKKKKKWLAKNKRVAITSSPTSIKFTATSMGALVSVVCVCGKEENITDVSVW